MFAVVPFLFRLFGALQIGCTALFCLGGRPYKLVAHNNLKNEKNIVFIKAADL